MINNHPISKSIVLHLLPGAAARRCGRRVPWAKFDTFGTICQSAFADTSDEMCQRARTARRKEHTMTRLGYQIPNFTLPARNPKRLRSFCPYRRQSSGSTASVAGWSG